MNLFEMVLTNGANSLKVQVEAKEGYKFVDDSKKEDKNELGHRMTIQIGEQVYEFPDKTQVKIFQEILSTIQYDL